tara:strand:- start:117 stop:302 length:186 start_codon:yes stop_codon:yes gene_type:complete
MSFETPSTDLETLAKSIADAFGWIDASRIITVDMEQSPRDNIQDLSEAIANAIKAYVDATT